MIINQPPDIPISESVPLTVLWIVQRALGTRFSCSHSFESGARLTVAEVLIVPVLPATFDIWSLDPLQELIQEAREINALLRTIVVLNAADPFGRDNDEAGAIIREKEYFDYFPHPIVRRKAFRNAAAAGLSVMEHRPVDEKAANEFGLFAAHLFGYAGDIPSISHANRKASLAQDKDERQAG